MANTAPDAHDAQWYRDRIDCLSGFMLPQRFETLCRVAGQRTRWMTVCTENTFHPQNASAIVRTCEAFGIQDIHTVESLCPFSPNLHIVRGTDKWIDLHRHATTAEAIAALRGAGYRIVATTPHSGDTAPEAFDVSAAPFAVVFGTEHAGVSDEMIAASDAFIRIPMCGFVESLNVSACASILLYQLSQRLRTGDAPWQLAEPERLQLLFRWLKASIGDAERILARRFPRP